MYTLYTEYIELIKQLYIRDKPKFKLLFNDNLW